MKGHEANSLMLSTHFVFLLALIPKDQGLKVVLMWVCCLSAFPGESPVRSSEVVEGLLLVSKSRVTPKSTGWAGAKHTMFAQQDPESEASLILEIGKPWLQAGR